MTGYVHCTWYTGHTEQLVLVLSTFWYIARRRGLFKHSWRQSKKRHMNFNYMCKPTFDVIIHHTNTQHTDYGGTVLQSTSNHRTDTKAIKLFPYIIRLVTRILTCISERNMWNTSNYCVIVLCSVWWPKSVCLERTTRTVNTVVNSMRRLKSFEDW